jgi:hypothetical protein
VVARALLLPGEETRGRRQPGAKKNVISLYYGR